MNYTPTRRAAVRRSLGAVTVSALALGSLALGSPALADTQTSGTASATVADVVVQGSAIHIDGTGWVGGSDAANGSTIGIKLGDALNTEPAAGAVTNPATGASTDSFDIWDAVEADADGSFSADITFPTTSNTSPALASPWAVGTTHTLRLLSGSLESGDTPRSVLLTFTIGDGLVTTATTATDGTATISFSGGTFPAGEVLSVDQGGTALQWTLTSGRTSTKVDTVTTSATGTITAKVVLAAGTAPAGEVTLHISGDQGTDQDVQVQVPPSVVFSNGAYVGATGTLTLGNLAPGAVISSVELGDTELTGDLTADDSEVATATYTIPATMAPVTQPLVITQTAPTEQTYTLSQTVTPDETASGTDGFDIVSNPEDQTFYQGFYQSAYSAAEDALYVTASDRGTGNDGYIYKLDPDTLTVEASYNTVDHDGFTKTGAFGIGVDDVNGNIWVSNTGSNSVAVYKESDLSLVKQFPASTISHPRDVVYDPSTDHVFVSSASEGSSASSTGYISVFDAKTYEKITDVQTGTRDVFNPVALTLADGELFSPSLGSNKVVKIDTAHATDTDYQPTFLTVDGINVGGRGASGIAYDAADDRLFIASQNSNEVVVADATSGATLKEVPTGKQALNVVYDPVRRLTYVANFGGTSVTVLDNEGNKVASLPIATANHVTTDGKGDVFVVDKATPTNRVWKITPTIAVSAGTPAIAGRPQVGVKVKASAGTWGSGTTLSYQWNRGGTAIAGATSARYTPVAADAGKKLTVTVTGSVVGAATDVAKTSAAKAVAKGTLKASTPKISGTAKVGKTVRATAGTWTAGTKLAYRWFAGGKAIKGATAKTLKLAKALRGKRIVVKVTGTKAGYASTTKASKPSAAVKR